MNRLTKTAIGAFAAAALAFPSIADAATWAIATGNVHLRAGPSVGYPVIVTVPRDGHVRIVRCRARRDWCRVSWHGTRGWMSGRFLARLEHRHRHLVYGGTYVPYAPFGSYGFYPDSLYAYGFGYGYDRDHGHFRRHFDDRYFAHDHHVVGVPWPAGFAHDHEHDGIRDAGGHAGHMVAGGPFDPGMRAPDRPSGHSS